MELPKLPVPIADFIPYLKQSSETPVAVEPFKAYENKLREVFAQEPDNPIIINPHVNVLPVYAGHEADLKVRARDLDQESKERIEKFVFPLSKEVRKPNGAPAVVESLKDFKKNFNLFCESSLADLNWDNVVAAGSSVVTALLPVPEKWADSKRTQRDYYHDILAPASDVDLFLYGLNEAQAIEKIRQIETCIRDSILTETTTIRTKNAISIVSQYPTRHVQIVLRLYKNVSEILTGFDVDCSCVAYDGSQVYASPRAIAAFATQTNTIDLTRRSPSYENRLSKYSHRGFEVYWEGLERTTIDPTVFERSFARVVGLARLLVLEKLPTPNDRDEYLATRRTESGRPAIYDPYKYRRQLPGNKKDYQPDDVAEWVEQDEVSSYHTFTIPYGPKYHAKKIEKLLYTKDLLLNAEWNRPKDRETELHRHPCFFGRVQDVIHDCCGYCPKPVDEEDEDIFEEESKIYVSGDIQFIKDDPGRQAIGSFHPLTDDDWTGMAYVGNTTLLCQAIVDGDLEHVQAWCEQEGNDVNRRDYTGRTPLHLATLCSTAEVVQCLVDHGARMIWRLVDGFTALHIAAWRGNAAMVKTLLEKSEANEEDEDRKEDARKAAKMSPSKDLEEKSESDDDGEDIGHDSDSDGSHTMTEGSFVKVRDEKPAGETMPDDSGDDEPDVFDVNVLAWDSPLSPLHLAIMGGHLDVIETLVQDFGADVLLPVKLPRTASAILALVLALQLDDEQSKAVTKKLLALGASPSQADMNQNSALHYVIKEGASEVLDVFFEFNEPAARNAINHLSFTGNEWSPSVSSPLITAIKQKKLDVIDKLLDLGAEPTISFDSFMKSWQMKAKHAMSSDPKANQKTFEKTIEQPITIAAWYELPQVIRKLLALGASPSTMTKGSYQYVLQPQYHLEGETILDIVRSRLKNLREFKGEKKKTDDRPPADLESDAHYLSGLENGTYRKWCAKGDIQQATSVHATVVKEYQGGLPTSEEGSKAKMEAIQVLIKGFEETEKDLLARGAKTFLQLHPELKDSRKANTHHTYTPQELKSEPFAIDDQFFVPHLNDAKKEGYTQLFQAAWDGDSQKIKSLTLGTWGESNPPLQIAVQDQRGFSAFSLAVYRGHLDLARTIVDISAAQYHPKDESGQRERFHLRGSFYSDNESEDSEEEPEDEVHVFRELVDDNFTIDDIGAVGNTVKSEVKPISMISWEAQFWRCLDLPELEAKKELDCEGNIYIRSRYYGIWRGPWTAFQQTYGDRNARQRCSSHRYAIKIGDKKLLRFLIDLETDLPGRESDDDKTDTSKMRIISLADFKYAMKLDRVDILQEIILRTGHGIPVQRLIKKSGIEVNEKPKYYQGLSVYGSKRKDWATAGRGTGYVPPEAKHSPLHVAAFEGSLESLAWFLGDEPLRNYKEFVRDNQRNLYLKKLADAEGGVDKALLGWLEARDRLALHAAIMEVATKGANSIPRIEMVLSKFPNALDWKSKKGITPLLLAVSLCRIDAVKYLIKAGADQTLRDAASRNLLHYILRPRNNNRAASLKSKKTMLDLVDKRLIKSMFLERCSCEPTSLTPLAYWLHSDFDEYRKDDNFVELQETLDLILDYSGNEVLELIDGAGDYPLHYIVKRGYFMLIPAILKRNSSLLFRENAVGITPLEMCNTKLIRNYIDHPPSIEGYHSVPTSLESKSPSDFVTRKSQSMSHHGETRRICLEAAKTHTSQKRKLVSLFDANAVAKRLASRKARRIGMDRIADVTTVDQAEDEGADEVTDWYQEWEWIRSR